MCPRRDRTRSSSRLQCFTKPTALLCLHSSPRDYLLVYMHPVKWCSGCLCGSGMQSSDLKCNMTTEDFYHLPLNIYVIILGIALFVFMLSLIICCYMFRLRRQSSREQYGYNQQMCAVCLEEFRSRDELGVCPCSHAFHKKCLLKWFEIRSVCPMCNKPISRLLPEASVQGTQAPQDPPDGPERLALPKRAQPKAKGEEEAYRECDVPC
ncbi:RING finger protein 122-like isoform X2 [Gadus macrocephalus]|uniref:RING finger protein 122-like isoform X2 n=1 Tax=Gadus macrocephalus TaxID=80720 RepID=UPI0028CB90EE|nr:RING finger protein 122-like isoform X2 [Gadus macrocephalus]